MKHGLHARHGNDLEGHSNFSSTIYSFSILCLELCCADQQSRCQVPLFTSVSLGLGLVSSGLGLGIVYLNGKNLSLP